MGQKLIEKQDTIICQVCEEVIDIVESTEGVKTWYGVSGLFQGEERGLVGGKINESSDCI